MQTEIYMACRIQLLTYILFISIKQSWCEHTNMSTCLGGLGKYGQRRGGRSKLSEGEVNSKFKNLRGTWHVCVAMKYRYVGILK